MSRNTVGAAQAAIAVIAPPARPRRMAEPIGPTTYPVKPAAAPTSAVESAADRERMVEPPDELHDRPSDGQSCDNRCHATGYPAPESAGQSTDTGPDAQPRGSSAKSWRCPRNRVADRRRLAQSPRRRPPPPPPARLPALPPSRPRGLRPGWPPPGWLPRTSRTLSATAPGIAVESVSIISSSRLIVSDSCGRSRPLSHARVHSSAPFELCSIRDVFSSPRLASRAAIECIRRGVDDPPTHCAADLTGTRRGRST